MIVHMSVLLSMQAAEFQKAQTDPLVDPDQSFVAFLLFPLAWFAKSSNWGGRSKSWSFFGPKKDTPKKVTHTSLFLVSAESIVLSVFGSIVLNNLQMFMLFIQNK